jgi:hypothetical protein
VVRDADVGVGHADASGPEHIVSGRRLGRTMPAHDEHCRLGEKSGGGPPGRGQRRKMPTMLMCPPQHGQGGGLPNVAGGSGSSAPGHGMGGTARSSRMRSRHAVSISVGIRAGSAERAVRVHFSKSCGEHGCPLRSPQSHIRCEASERVLGRSHRSWVRPWVRSRAP